MVNTQYQYQYLQEAKDNTQYQYQYCQDAKVNTQYQYQYRAQGQYLNTNTRYCWCLILILLLIDCPNTRMKIESKWKALANKEP